MAARDSMLDLKKRIGESIVGQQAVIDRLLIALLADGHVLMEGLPGLAKTRTIKTLAKNLESSFHREFEKRRAAAKRFLLTREVPVLPLRADADVADQILRALGARPGGRRG